MSNEIFSKEYLEWVKQANLPPLTNSQHKFAEYLLNEKQIGNMDDIYKSITKYLRKS